MFTKGSAGDYIGCPSLLGCESKDKEEHSKSKDEQSTHSVGLHVTGAVLKTQPRQQQKNSVLLPDKNPRTTLTHFSI